MGWLGFELGMGRLMSGGEEVVFLGEAGVLRDGWMNDCVYNGGYGPSLHCSFLCAG